MLPTIPKHIILSRKGWDTKAGGKPSPIFPDGTLGMIPIPDTESGIRYEDLQFANGTGMNVVVERLTGKRVVGSREVHLDPDIRVGMVKGRKSFIPAFGQCGAAQSHLENEGVQGSSPEMYGDLFLFFGLYREVDQQLAYKRGKPNVHVIFGWLQVGKVITVRNEVPGKLSSHPHARRSEIVRNELASRKVDNNTIYVGRDELSFESALPGAGVFHKPFHISSDDPRQISMRDQRKCSLWSLPAFFRSLSNMGEQCECRGDVWHPQRRGPGQEFVLNTSGREKQVGAWLLNLFQCTQE